MFRGHFEDAQGEPLGEIRGIALGSLRPEEDDSRACHERRTHELVGARFLMIAIDQRKSRPHAKQCPSRRLALKREMRRVSGKLHRRPQEGGSQRVS